MARRMCKNLENLGSQVRTQVLGGFCTNGALRTQVLTRNLVSQLRNQVSRSWHAVCIKTPRTQVLNQETQFLASETRFPVRNQVSREKLGFSAVCTKNMKTYDLAFSLVNSESVGFHWSIISRAYSTVVLRHKHFQNKTLQKRKRMTSLNLR